MRMWLLYPILLTLLAIRTCGGGPELVPPPTAGPVHMFSRSTGFTSSANMPNNCVQYQQAVPISVMIQAQTAITITQMELEITTNFQHGYRWIDPLTEVNQLLPLVLMPDSSPLTVSTLWTQEDMLQQTGPQYGASITLLVTYENRWEKIEQDRVPVGYVGIDQYTYLPYFDGSYDSVPCNQLQ